MAATQMSFVDIYTCTQLHMGAWVEETCVRRCDSINIGAVRSHIDCYVYRTILDRDTHKYNYKYTYTLA